MPRGRHRVVDQETGQCTQLRLIPRLSAEVGMHAHIAPGCERWRELQTCVQTSSSPTSLLGNPVSTDCVPGRHYAGCQGYGGHQTTVTVTAECSVMGKETVQRRTQAYV